MRDLKVVAWSSCSNFNLRTTLHQLSDQVKTPEIQAVVTAYRDNVLRALELADFPHQVSMSSKRLQLAETIALYRTLGKIVWDNGETSDERQRVWRVRDELLRGEGEPPRLVYYQTYVSIGETHDMLPPDVAATFESLMKNQVVMAWTAFETLAADLWRSAVNARPSVLAKMSGSSNRIDRLSHGRPKTDSVNKSGSEEEEKGKDLTGLTDKKISLRVADIDRLTRGSFDIRHALGTLLSRQMKFATLDGVREAYSKAFPPKYRHARSDGIDGALANKAIDALCAVRNLIVHRAGLADQIYLDDQKQAPTAPLLELNAPLLIDGEVTRALVEPVLICCNDLVSAVDKWITQTEGK